MNYRHAFHAGNHADCLKHALLLLLLDALKRKDAPFAVLDTHAGRGLYDLSADEAAPMARCGCGASPRGRSPPSSRRWRRRGFRRGIRVPRR